MGFSAASTTPARSARVTSENARDRAEGAHLRVQDEGRLDAHAQAAEVPGGAQGALGRERLEPVVPVGEADDALRLEELEERAPDPPLGHLLERGVVREEEGQVEDLELPQ